MYGLFCTFRQLCHDDTSVILSVLSTTGAVIMFITFEGTDGSGKSTQARQLVQTLRDKKYNVLHTREPGGTRIGDQIRTILLDDMSNTNMMPQAELLLFCASRAQLVGEIIRPFTGGLTPDLTIYLDLDPLIGLERRRKGRLLMSEDWTRLDDMELAFHRRVYDGYQHLIAEYPQRWLTIPAQESPEKVQKAIWKMLSPKLPKAKKVKSV
jgi:dTMP kinase